MRLSLCHFYHSIEICNIRNISGNVESKEPRQHNCRLYLSPINVWLGLQNSQIVLICLVYGWPAPLDSSSVTFIVARTFSACYHRRQRNTGDVPHFNIARRNFDLHSFSSFFKFALANSSTADKITGTVADICII